MFFLILLGRGRGEKNYAGFGVVLREFSRGVVGGCWRACWNGQPGCPGKPGIGERRPAGTADDVRGPCDKGLSAKAERPHPWNAQRSDWSSKPDVHNGGLPGRSFAHAHRWIAQGFEWRRGRDVHTSAGPWSGRIPTLTVEIHSATSDCRREISTPSAPCPTDAAFALTVPMHRFVSRFGRAISTPLPAVTAFGSAGQAVGTARDSRCSFGARRVPVSPGWSLPQAPAGLWNASVRAAAQSSEIPARVWISPPADTENPVNLEGEHRLAIERGCRFGWG